MKIQYNKNNLILTKSYKLLLSVRIRRGKPVTSYKRTSFIVNYNIVAGTSWPQGHRNGNIVFKIVNGNIVKKHVNHGLAVGNLCWELKKIRHLRFLTAIEAILCYIKLKA